MSLTKRARLIRDLELTDKDVGEIVAAAYQVWTDIAYDLLMAIAEEKGKAIEAVTVPRRVVIECVLDADRLAEKLGRTYGGKPTSRLSDAGKRAIAQQYDLGPARDLLALLMKDAFPYRTYGM